MSGEGFRDPRVLVRPVPDGDTDTSVRIGTSPNGIGIVGRLLGEQRVGGWERHADIQLGEGDVDPKRSECGHVTGLGIPAGRAANDQVGLKTNTVDFGAVRLDELDDFLRGGGFGPGGFDVVIVVVEFGVGVCGRGCGECDGDVSLADVLVEDAVAVRAILV